MHYAKHRLNSSVRLSALVKMLVVGAMVGGVFDVPAVHAGTSGQFCIKEKIGGNPPCTANDVRIGKLEVLSGPSSCNLGDVITVTMKATIESGPDRYDIGIWINESGGSARTDPDGTCYRDYFAPPLSETACNKDGGPYYNGELPTAPGDTCGDVYAQNTDPCGNATNNADCTAAGVPNACCTGAGEGTCRIRPCESGGGDCLYSFFTFTVDIICSDSDADGIADVGTCTSWDNQVDDNCTSELETDPGTGSKCNCSPDESGIAVGEITICGNGVVEGLEECDPGTPVVGDCCNDACLYEPADTPCDDGLFCTSSSTIPGDPDSCDATGTCTSNPVDCDDGAFCSGIETCNETTDTCDSAGNPCPDDGVFCTVDSCNEMTDSCDYVPTDSLCDNTQYCDGMETCDPDNDCQPGIPPDCDDGVSCTLDSCNESTDQCDNNPLDSVCDDNQPCNGVETCDPINDCQPGTPPDCDDGIACTIDSCDPATGACVHAPDDSLCNNGLYCDGVETCDPNVGCVAGTPPDCDDGVICTIDACDEENDTCTNTPSDSVCSNGQYCDGVETCDPINDCQPGTPPNCDDGVGCTMDSCDEINDVCVNSPDDSQCNDGQYCNGEETCDPVNDCQPGTPPDCDDGVACTEDACDETNDTCTNTPVNGNCNDMVSCTVDVCDPVTGCSNTADDSLCDDGQYCNGAETCDPVNDCQAGTPPNCDDGVACTEDACDEADDTCTNTPVNANCDDMVACTIDICDPINGCSNDPDDSLCDNGLYCDGAETCDPINGCQDEPDPCSEPLRCDEGDDQCVECLSDGQCDDGQYCNGVETCQAGVCVAGTPPNCDDGVGCTVDSCNEDTDSCDNLANDSLCDDGAYCNGAETCDAVNDCQAGTPPNCDDGVGCTVDSCNEDTDSCDNLPNDSLCDDGAHCNGVETCDPVNDCQAGTPPNCDDGVGCTVDSCNEDTDSCDNLPNDSLCDDGAHCNGVETCDPINDCQVGTPPNCDDGVGCTVDSCNEDTDSCDNVPTDSLCDNGQFCDGAETCDSVNDCQAGTPPNCDDGVSCTDDSCDETNDQCVNAPNDGSCDDGAHCNGVETCDPVNDCQAGAPPNCNDNVDCTVDSCNEGTDSCDNVPDDALCDNGQYCDGIEVCDAVNGCKGGMPVLCDDGVGCTVDACDETSDECVNTPDDSLCTNGQFCDGAETCDPVNDCQPGTPPDCDDGVSCTVESCDEVSDECVSTPDNGLCNDNNVCTTDTCDPMQDCVNTGISCDDGDPCTVDTCDPETGCESANFCGACCVDQTCQQVGLNECLDLGGEFLGIHVECTPDLCLEGVPTVSEWGLAILALLLLTLAKLQLRREPEQIA